MPCKNCKIQGRFGCVCDDMDDCEMFDDYRHTLTPLDFKNHTPDDEMIEFNVLMYKCTLSPEQIETMQWASSNIPFYNWERSIGLKKHLRRQYTTPNEENKGSKSTILHKMEEDTP